MAIYYNDFEPYAAQWLRNLIAAGHLPAGDVDERSITEVTTDDLKGYTQCHFFAGIGGWPLALRWAGWPDDRPVWTGSCPCQPFSGAGRRRGANDERHLWPAFYSLIAECQPPIVFGEQVSGALGREWLCAVRADMEDSGYAVGCADLSAAGVGAPHIRQRLYWVANRSGGWLANAGHGARGDDERRALSERHESECGDTSCGPVGAPSGLAYSDGGEVDAPTARGLHAEPGERRTENGLGDTHGSQGARQRQVGVPLESEQEADGPSYSGAWQDITFIECADGTARPTQSGLYPLAHGVPNRVGLLRAYGNAIVPQVGAVFIDAAMAVIDGERDE